MHYGLSAGKEDDHVIGNEYVSTAIQKGWIPGFVGRLEHTGVLSQIRHEILQKSNLYCHSIPWNI